MPADCRFPTAYRIPRKYHNMYKRAYHSLVNQKNSSRPHRVFTKVDPVYFCLKPETLTFRETLSGPTTRKATSSK